jgi:hypothetical protein
MDFLYPSTPAYKGMNAPAQAPAGFLGSLFGGLLSGGTPVYKTVSGNGAYAPAPSTGWWQVFTGAPSYQTAPSSIAAPDAASAADPSSDASGACPIEPTTQVVIL